MGMLLILEHTDVFTGLIKPCYMCLFVLTQEVAHWEKVEIT
jgi:hypothetical protein